MKYIITILLSYICFYGWAQYFGDIKKYDPGMATIALGCGLQRDTPHPKAAKLYAHTIDSIAIKGGIGWISFDSIRHYAYHKVYLSDSTGRFLASMDSNRIWTIKDTIGSLNVLYDVITSNMERDYQKHQENNLMFEILSYIKMDGTITNWRKFQSAVKAYQKFLKQSLHSKP